MNGIVSACFVDFDRVKITSVDPLGEGCSVSVCKTRGREKLFSISGDARDIVVEVGEIDVCATYFATVVYPNGERSSAVKIRKDTLYDTDEFNKRYNYDGRLGVKYAAAKSDFSVWAPFAKAVELCIYNSGLLVDTSHAKYKMKRSASGVWTASVKGDLNGKFYTYSIESDGSVCEAVDPYVTSAGRNGARGAIFRIAATDPDGFRKHAIPEPLPFSSQVIYEAHLRDLTISSPAVSEAHRGKFLGLTEKGEGGVDTPLDYIEKLGVSAVHFQPMFDFASVDESFKTATRNKDGEFNWGYDPLNYNVPEGSYSTDPDDPASRVRELKQMIMTLHARGIRVILDVVYNHVYDASTSNFQALLKNYYFRTDESGELLNGSGCGNETASERYMFRRFIIDSVSHWAKEYMVDGFRFDLMALHDVDTMNAVVAALKKINPAIVVYGEGWDAGSNGLPPELRACKANARKLPDIAFFDDIVRDGLRGSVFDIEDNGFVSGKKDVESAVFVAAAGATDIVGEAMYGKLGSDKKAFAVNPSQNINYVSVHDNSTLWDKLNASVDGDEETLKAMNRLAVTAVMTGQGASLILAGEEMLRSKPTTEVNDYDNHPKSYITRKGYMFADNSYRSPDSVNEIDWTCAHTNADMVDFYRELIGIKRKFPQFQIADRDTLSEVLYFGQNDGGLAAFAVRDPKSDEFAFVMLNAGDKARAVELPLGDYSVYVNADSATSDRDNPIAKLFGNRFILPSRASAVMTAIVDDAKVEEWSDATRERNEEKTVATAIKLDADIPSIALTVSDVKNGIEIFDYVDD